MPFQKNPNPPPKPTVESSDASADEIRHREDIAIGIIADGLITLLLRERYEQIEREQTERRLVEDERMRAIAEERCKRRRRGRYSRT